MSSSARSGALASSSRSSGDRARHSGDPARHSGDPSKPVAVAEYPFPHQAELAAGFLRDAEIPVRVALGDGQAAGIGMIGHGTKVWVRSEDESIARDVLREAFSDTGDPSGDGDDQG